MTRTRPTIHTARLHLAPIHAGDASPLHTLWTDPDVREYLWDGEAIPRSQTNSVIVQNQTLFNERGFGLWGLREADDPRLIGLAGFWHFRDPPERELLYAVHRDHWGNGFATEAARAVVRFGFQELSFTEIVASTDAPNTSSIRVLEKIGMTWKKEETRDGLETIFYSIVAANYADDDFDYRVTRR